MAGLHQDLPAEQHGEGVLEVVGEGFGFLRSTRANFAPDPQDIYVSPAQIRRFGLQTGHCIGGVVRPPVGTDRYRGLMRIDSVNGQNPDLLSRTLPFEDLPAVHPTQRIGLQCDPSDLLTRMIDLIAPLGLGQRMLISTPSHSAGSLLLPLGNALVRSCPKAIVMVLMVDARPEEVEDLKQHSAAEVIASTFDGSAHQHIRIAEITMQKAKRHLELGQHAIVLLDSMARLARAYDRAAPTIAGSERILPCGMRASALEQVRGIFAMARNTRLAGSLTILATTPAHPASPADQAVLEEVEELANACVQLSGHLGEHCFAPAIDLALSATYREDLLREPEELGQIRHLRRLLADKEPREALQCLTDHLRKTSSNAQFVEAFSPSAFA